METFSSDFLGKGLYASIAKLALCSGIYNIWKTRNDITFNDGQFNKLKLLKDIELEVHFTLNGCGLKDKHSVANRFIATSWDVQFLSS